METKTDPFKSAARRWRPLAAVWLGLASLVVQAQTVVFPDPNMQLAVQHELDAMGVTSVPVTEAKMLLLTNLPAANSDITNTKGLEYASDLEVLFLNGNPIADFSGITNLTTLTTLDIGQTPVTNIDFLSNLTNIQSISLFGNGRSAILRRFWRCPN